MRGHDSLDHLRRVFAVLALAMLWSADAARADQILQTSSDSLTTYKYSGNTRVQGVRPRAEQRGVGFGGAQRAGGSLPWALAGNPFESAQAGETLGSLRLATGAYAPAEIDLALPAQVSWIVGRTFNARQTASGGAHLDSDGYQGRNWFQISQPEIRLYDADGNAGTKQAADLVYLVYGADRYVEFKRTADNADTFRGVNGAAGVFKYESGSPDLYVYTDQNGNRTYFFGSNAQVTIGLDTFDTAWQLWKFVDPSGNTAYVGHATTASTAISSGYYKNDGQHDGRIKLAFDSEGRRYCYTYSTPAGDSVARLAQVVAEIDAGGGWGDCGTDLLEPKARWNHFEGAVSGTPYPDLDRFNRVEDSRWTSYKGTGTRNFYSVAIAYDPASNILGVTDNVHKNSGGNRNFDALYTLDALNRLTRADEGTLTWSGGTGTISNRSRDERWLDASGNLALSQTGNWLRRRLDLNGDGNFTGGGGELDDTGVFSLANELKTRDTDSNGTANYTLAYDKSGNQTADGLGYGYTYDAFGRLVAVHKETDTGVVYAQYRYNGLGFRIGWRYDTSGNGYVDAGDPWYYFCYDDSWRIVATFRATDTYPKGVFVYHNAGFGGYGGSSYIDSVILRDKEVKAKWSEEATEERGERRYYCQNWRADVSALLTDAGSMVEWVKYSSYGVPFALPAGDTDSDGDWDATDSGNITGTYDVRKDANLDGVINASDVTHANSITGGYQTLGRGRLSSSGVDNRKGYAGYEYDPTLEAAGKHLYHVRHRVYDADIGRWTRRDPLGYVDGMSLYEYVQSEPIQATDWRGLYGGSCESTGCQARLGASSPHAPWLAATAPPPDGYPKPNVPNPDDLKWEPNRKYDPNNPLQRPGQWVDPDGNRWTLHPEDCDHREHWDKKPRKGPNQRIPTDPSKPIFKRPGKPPARPGRVPVKILPAIISTGCVAACATSYDSCLSKANDEYESCLKTAGTFKKRSDQLEYEALCDRVYFIDATSCSAGYLACGLACLLPFSIPGIN